MTEVGKSSDPEMDDGLLDVARLVDMFETAEDATTEGRKLAERDRDYVDGKQFTAAEVAELKKRKQPITIINRIKRKVDFMRGYEMSRRVDPKAMPRTPKHEHDADAIQQALRYVADEQDFDRKRSRVFDNLLVEGSGGYRVAVKQGYGGMDITIDRVQWDRMFADPHSCEPDFSDASYIGGVIWKDYDDAKREYPGQEDALTETLNTSTLSDTYDDKPKHKIWADRARKRVRIVYMWIKRGDDWHFAEFTKGGILKAGPSPYVTDKGESDCELAFGSAYVDRENNRYGIVREMISPQDEINKRRSKSLHLLNVAQVTAEEGVISDMAAFRREAAKPDGVMLIAPGGSDKIKTETRLDLATGHMQLLQEAKGEIDMMAGNIALQGNALQKSQASGKAIIASQQGGAMEIAPIMDALSHLDVHVFRKVYYRIRQFWTAEKWVRVTDDERNVKWLGLNVDPQQVEMMAAQNPEMAQKIAGTVAKVAEIDCDIIVSDAPDGITPQLEQFEAIVQLKTMDANNEIPMMAVIEAMPNLKAKERILAKMEERQPSPEQQMAQQLEMRGMQAKVADTEAAAMLKQAQAQAVLRPEQSEPQAVEQGPTEAELYETLMSGQDKEASAFLKRAQAEKARVETMLAPQQMQAQIAAARMKAQQPRPAAR